MNSRKPPYRLIGSCRPRVPGLGSRPDNLLFCREAPQATLTTDELPCPDRTFRRFRTNPAVHIGIAGRSASAKEDADGVTHVTVHPDRFGNDAARTIQRLPRRPDFALLAIGAGSGIRLYRLR